MGSGAQLKKILKTMLIVKSKKGLFFEVIPLEMVDPMLLGNDLKFKLLALHMKYLRKDVRKN